MKRDAVALLIHPYKNRLLPRLQLREAVDSCVRDILKLASEHKGMRFNVVVPGYMLENVDPLLLSELREVQKGGGLEFLVTGYTEPFLSLSPRWLSRENIRRGIETCSELIGCKPFGYVPAFSNWEPSYIDIFRELGFNYAVLSQALFSGDCRHHCGCWATEHSGSSIILFPLHVLHHYTAPANIKEWLENLFSQDTQGLSPVKILGIHYLVPLVSAQDTHPFEWLKSATEILDKMLLKYQTVCFSEFLSDNMPLGLQHIAPSLIFDDDDEDRGRSFWNRLFSYNQVGIIHRKMMDVCDNIASRPRSRSHERLIKKLFFVQDINRYLPARESGFPHIADRFWCYRKLIEIEQTLWTSDNFRGGQIRIVDYLRNGSKNIIMANKAFTVCIDHRNGGNVFELDFKDRTVNLFAGYNSRRHLVPNVIVAGESKTAFVDHFLPFHVNHADFVGSEYAELGDFLRGRFDYKVKKSPRSVKAILTRQGALVQADKNCPLNMEKVFALENDDAVLSFVYQLSNGSLTSYRFTFATEITFSLLGAAFGSARLVSGKSVYKKLASERISLKQVTELMLVDDYVGMKIGLTTQKPVNIWCFPLGRATKEKGPYQGTTLVISLPVTLEGNSAWTLMGKLTCKKIRIKGEKGDAI